MICITPSDLILKRDDRVLGIWPLRYLRKYGRDGDLFSIEAGRKCEHGPGVMEFVTSKSEDIFTHVERFVILIARKKGGATSDAASALVGINPAALFSMAVPRSHPPPALLPNSSPERLACRYRRGVAALTRRPTCRRCRRARMRSLSPCMQR